MSRPLWRLTNIIFRGLERVYHRVYDLRPVGSLLYLQPRKYEGPERVLADSTRLRPGDSIAVLHFNNEALSQAQAKPGRRHGGFAFARLLVQALQSLAQRVQQDPEFADVAGFGGVTWIPPHGRKIGFEAEPLPDTWRTRLLGCYFRLLLYAFNPDASQRVGKRLHPHEFWLSRGQLLENFAEGRQPR